MPNAYDNLRGKSNEVWREKVYEREKKCWLNGEKEASGQNEGKCRFIKRQICRKESGRRNRNIERVRRI